MQSVDMEAVQGQEEIGENENVDDVAVGRAEADEEVRKPKPANRPYTPTRMEIYEHEVTHLPYRNWCKHCSVAEEWVLHIPRRTRRKRSGSQ